MEEFFRAMNCFDSQKVTYVDFLLVRETEYWSDSKRFMKGKILLKP